MASIPGSWTLKYSWGCSTSYGTATLTFSSGGTFTDNFGGSGKWSLVEGTVFWRYSTSETVYAGHTAGNAMSGGMSTFAGLTGCWYTLKSGVSAVAAKGQALDPAGNKLGSKGRASKKSGSKKAGGGKK